MFLLVAFNKLCSVGPNQLWQRWSLKMVISFPASPPSISYHLHHQSPCHEYHPIHHHHHHPHHHHHHHKRKIHDHYPCYNHNKHSQLVASINLSTFQFKFCKQSVSGVDSFVELETAAICGFYTVPSWCCRERPLSFWATTTSPANAMRVPQSEKLENRAPNKSPFSFCGLFSKCGFAFMNNDQCQRL